MTTVANVKRIVAEAAKGIPGAEVIAPLPVWDGQHGSMGVQIKAPQLRGIQKCEIVAGFVLTKRDLALESLVRLKAVTAVNAMRMDVQVTIRVLKADCGICKGTGKVITGWQMPGAPDSEIVLPGDPCPKCTAKAKPSERLARANENNVGSSA